MTSESARFPWSPFDVDPALECALKSSGVRSVEELVKLSSEWVRHQQGCGLAQRDEFLALIEKLSPRRDRTEAATSAPYWSRARDQPATAWLPVPISARLGNVLAKFGLDRPEAVLATSVKDFAGYRRTGRALMAEFAELREHLIRSQSSAPAGASAPAVQHTHLGHIQEHTQTCAREVMPCAGRGHGLRAHGAELEP